MQTIAEILKVVSGWDGVLVVSPGPGDGSPEIAWGDSFIYYEPEGTMPKNRQPFATIVTKDYPDDHQSLLDREGVYRVNFHPGPETFTARAEAAGTDATVLDQFIVHPVYGPYGWLAVLNPGDQTSSVTEELLREAYELDRIRYERRRVRRKNEAPIDQREG